jgi:hypothetical protein
MSHLIEVESLLTTESDQPKFDGWVVGAQDLVKQYPTSGEICRVMLDRHDRLTRAECYEEAKQLLEAVITSYGEHVPPDGRDGAEFADRYAVSEIQLDRWPTMIRDNPTGSAALVEPILVGARKLEQEQRVTHDVVDQFIGVAEMMEYTHQYESLNKMRDELAKIFTSDTDPSQRFQEYCSASSRRVASVGKAFSLPSPIAIGQAIDPAIFENRVTAVVFWSAADPGSIETMEKLDVLYTSNKKKPFRVMAINVDRDLDRARALIAKQTVDWTLIVASGLDATGSNPLAVEYGIRATPYMLLVDGKGIVVGTGLDLRELWTRAQKLVPELTLPDSRGQGRRGRGGR